MFRVGRSDADVHTYKRIYSPIYQDGLEAFLRSKVSLKIFNLIIERMLTKLGKIFI